MGDEEDIFARWVQGICAIILFALAFTIGYWNHISRPTYTYTSGRGSSIVDGAVIGSGLLGIRCLWYAITGRNNVNRDDF